MSEVDCQMTRDDRSFFWSKATACALRKNAAGNLIWKEREMDDWRDSIRALQSLSVYGWVHDSDTNPIESIGFYYQQRRKSKRNKGHQVSRAWEKGTSKTTSFLLFTYGKFFHDDLPIHLNQFFQDRVVDIEFSSKTTSNNLQENQILNQ